MVASEKMQRHGQTPPFESLSNARGSQHLGRAGLPPPENDGGPSEVGAPLPVRFAR